MLVLSWLFCHHCASQADKLSGNTLHHLSGEIWGNNYTHIFCSHKNLLVKNNNKNITKLPLELNSNMQLPWNTMEHL